MRNAIHSDYNTGESPAQVDSRNLGQTPTYMNKYTHIYGHTQGSRSYIKLDTSAPKSNYQLADENIFFVLLHLS